MFLVRKKNKKKKHITIRDHNHYTGEYRGAAHVICNLRYSTQVDIPAYLHNGSKYDFNLIIKLMNNSVFGKTIENVRKRREINLIVTEERRKKLVSEPNYASCTALSDHLLAVEMRKTGVLMDKPILVGQAILDKSKEPMYDFFYDYLKRKYPKYPNKIKLCYMDTDSFILDIERDDFFEDTKKDLEKRFDTSNYHKDMILPEEYAKNGHVNKKVIGKMNWVRDI